ncbi:hypothetical protein ACFL3V_05435 [Nanoarchaeota archaeon]
MEKEKPRYRKTLVSRVKKFCAGAALGLGLTFGAYNADASPPPWQSVHSAPSYRAMGKAGDLTSDARIPSNAALQKSKREVTFNVRANPGKIGDAPDELEDMLDLDCLIDEDTSIVNRLLGLVDRVDGFNVDIEFDMRLEAYATFGEDWFGRYVAGAYGAFDYMMQMGGLKDIGIEDIQFDGDITKPYIDLGEDKTVFDAQSLIRSGAYFGYGRRFKVKNSYIAVGLRGTAAQMSYNPIARVQFKKIIKGVSDIETDNEDKVEGGGLLLDVHTTALLRDSLFNSRIGLGLTNFGAVWYSDGRDEGIAPGVAVGLAIHPLHALKHDNLLLAFDVENIGTGYTEVQAGMSYRLGFKRLALIPKLGVILNEPDTFSGKGNDIITAGASLDAGTMQLTGIVEYNTTKDKYLFNLGIGGRF